MADLLLDFDLLLASHIQLTQGQLNSLLVFLFLCCMQLGKEDFLENLHVLSCFVQLKSVLLISSVFWVERVLCLVCASWLANRGLLLKSQRHVNRQNCSRQGLKQLKVSGLCLHKLGKAYEAGEPGDGVFRCNSE